jgi:hypothetical protein
MKRISKAMTETETTSSRLRLNRETVRKLDDDALHQVMGGAGARSSHKLNLQ